MTAAPELSGVDLARQALLAAREAAKKNGAQTKRPKRRTGTTLRRDGREPLGLGAAITMMMTERGLVAPAAGGSVLAQWEAILAAAAPELAGHVQAVKFDADTGRLDVAPNAPAYGTKVRWIAPKLIAAANEKVPGANVRSLHVLPPAAAPPRTSSAEAAGTSLSSGDRTTPAGQVKTPRTPSAGYRRALEAHRAAAPEPFSDPAAEGVAERQIQAMRERSLLDFPELAEDDPVPLEKTELLRRHQTALTQTAALRRARAERAARQHTTTGSHTEERDASYEEPAA
ncbi:DciA family protein [Streptomyces sp. NPDC047718]|uniref:DciA family protein n=1 Tax=Streptomyces sp. NPDC047718 TaxID=3155479 RepID=UPI0033EAE3C9